MTTKLSVVFPAMRGWESARAALATWFAQTRADDLEILLVAPDADESIGELAGAVVPVASGTLDLHEARALGIRRATGSHVVLAEDHCVPDPDYAAAILPLAEQGWDVIGPALRPGSGRTAVGQASFLLGYGQWLHPDPARTTSLPGHNIAIRRELLADLGEQLEAELLLAAFFVARLQATARCRVEPAARMRHFDATSLRRALWIFLIVGLGFGARRTRSWSPVTRLLYPLASPAVAARHWLRGLREYLRAGGAAGMSPACLAAAAPLAVAWAIGEAAGSLAGPARVAPLIWQCEVKPVSELALQHSARTDLRPPA